MGLGANSSYLIKDENRLKRARHANAENQHTLKAQAALPGRRFGKDLVVDKCFTLLSEHLDYEVTGLELDTLVATAWAARRCASPAL